MLTRSIEFHIVEIILALWSLYVGLLFLIGYEVSMTVDMYVPILGIIYGLSFMFAGFITIFGVVWWGKRLNIGWIFLRAGLFLSVSNWLAYSAMVFWAFPESFLGYGNPFVIGILNFALYMVSMIREVRYRHYNDTK